MAKLLRNITAKVGKYTDKDGKEKNNTITVGEIWQTQYGISITLRKWFNPMAVEPASEGSQNIFLNCYEPKKDDMNAKQANSSQSSGKNSNGFGNNIVNDDGDFMGFF